MRNMQKQLLAVLLAMLSITACASPTGAAVDISYIPVSGLDWETSTPAQEGLDPDLVSRLYGKAENHDTLESLLIVKNGKLVAEKYFNEGSIDKQGLMQSVSKSYVSALIGLAIKNGCLEGVQQEMFDFFPEYESQIQDERKLTITIQQMLQMRSGYPWEETHPDLMAALFAGDNPPLVLHFPLTADPGTVHQYSNTTSSWLAAIVSRACETNLKDFSERYLFDPLGVETGEFWENKYNDYYALFHLTGRDNAKFGQLFLDEGKFNGEQILPAEWVRDSFQVYSTNISTGGPQNGKIGRYFKDISYGYQWWSARVGKHTFNYAAGHGGQLIIIIEDLDMVIVTTAHPFFMQHDGESWKNEKAVFNLVGSFIQDLPQN